MLTELLLPVTFACVSTVVPLRLVDHYPVVDDVYVDRNGPFHFLVDTGFQSTSLDERLAEKLGLIPDYLVTLVTQSGERDVRASRLQAVEFGGIAAQSELLWLDLASARRLSSRIQGILGQAFLSRFGYILDYGRRRLVLNPCEALSGPASVRVPVERSDGRLVVTVQANGRDLKLVLDSGTSDLILFGQSAGQHITIMTNVGSAAGTRTRLPVVTMGESKLFDIPAVVLPQANRTGIDGLLPTRLFDSIYVNHAENYVILDPPIRK